MLLLLPIGAEELHDAIEFIYKFVIERLLSLLMAK